MLRRIAILTGDDDAPGTNAVIRAVTRAAFHKGWEVTGICDGYTGLLSGDFIPLTARGVEGIVQRGGTMLGSVESGHFLTAAGQKQALASLTDHGIDALVVIGGGESLAGALALSQLGFRVSGVAASVENDLAGFDPALGVDTALNLALDTIDHLRITKSADGWAILVEVAGRRCGFLALASVVASGAETSVIPEIEMTPEQVEHVIVGFHEQGILRPIIVVSEGAPYNTDRLMRHFTHISPLDHRPQAVRLGHIQRRAAPNAFDRLLGTRLGAGAVDALARDERGVVVGFFHDDLRTLPLAEVVGKTKEVDSALIHLADVLAPLRASAAVSQS